MEVSLLEQDLCWIEIKGPDSGKFLNSVLTNNVQKLQGKSGCYNLLLTPKGKIIADCFCYPCGDHFGITCETPLKPKIVETLKKYIVFQKVAINDQSEKWGAFSLLGEGAKGLLQENSELFVMEKTRWGFPCCEVWARKEKLSELKANLNLPFLSEEEQTILRIESGTPQFEIDFDENSLPQEAGLYPALSFDKGCYIGQEIVARLEHRGHVAKQLVQLLIESKIVPPHGEKIFSTDGKEIGFVTSSCFSPKQKSPVALGYLRYPFLNSEEVKIAGKTAKVRCLVKDKFLN